MSNDKGGKAEGLNTSVLHEHLVNAVRWGAKRVLMTTWPERYPNEFSCLMCPDGGLLPGGRGYRPDVTIIGGREVLVAEIGGVNQKGPWPIVHVSFFGGVVVINPSGTQFEDDVLHAVRVAVGEAMNEWADRVAS